MLCRNEVSGELRPYHTKVSVNARYILNMSGTVYSYNYMTGQSTPSPVNNTWSFDSNTRQTVNVQNATPGIIPTRTCQPTGEAESDVIDAIMSI